MTYPGKVVVGETVIEIGRSCLRMEYAVALAGAPDEPCGPRHRRGGPWCATLTMEKVRVPDEVRAAINAREKATL